MARLAALSPGEQTMIGYVTLGTNDMVRAGEFYDALLAEVGGKRQMETERFISWSAGPTSPGIGVIKPFDGKAATVGNGMMVALMCDSPAKVKAIYDKAVKLGGKDEGPPGLRWGNFYAAYFRDLDGNKLNAFCMSS
jgi:catechol 2,3-dioxygenase-like lactoylglutathione lyase family enzyme